MMLCFVSFKCLLQVWAGAPAKYLRDVLPEEKGFITASASNYQHLAKVHKCGCGMGGRNGCWVGSGDVGFWFGHMAGHATGYRVGHAHQRQPCNDAYCVKDWCPCVVAENGQDEL